MPTDFDGMQADEFDGLFTGMDALRCPCPKYVGVTIPVHNHGNAVVIGTQGVAAVIADFTLFDIDGSYELQRDGDCFDEAYFAPPAYMGQYVDTIFTGTFATANRYTVPVWENDTAYVIDNVVWDGPLWIALTNHHSNSITNRPSTSSSGDWMEVSVPAALSDGNNVTSLGLATWDRLSIRVGYFWCQGKDTTPFGFGGPRNMWIYRSSVGRMGGDGFNYTTSGLNQQFGPTAWLLNTFGSGFSGPVETVNTTMRFYD